jgi:AcrR family transcriptional regulator
MWIVIFGSCLTLVRQTVPSNIVTVMPDRRRYTMSARADAMAGTRQQIIDAAADRLRVSAEPLTLLGVAARADVSRATVYRHFASVTGLLDAVAADLLARARFDQLLAALQDEDPVRALRQSLSPGPGSGPPTRPWSATCWPWPARSPRQCQSSPSSNTAA